MRLQSLTTLKVGQEHIGSSICSDRFAMLLLYCYYGSQALCKSQRYQTPRPTTRLPGEAVAITFLSDGRLNCSVPLQNPTNYPLICSLLLHFISLVLSMLVLHSNCTSILTILIFLCARFTLVTKLLRQVDYTQDEQGWRDNKCQY
jgi:hypothetical protein